MAISAALILLGPGAFSLDAKIFGRLILRGTIGTTLGRTRGMFSDSDAGSRSTGVDVSVPGSARRGIVRRFGFFLPQVKTATHRSLEIHVQ